MLCLSSGKIYQLLTYFILGMGVHKWPHKWISHSKIAGADYTRGFACTDLRCTPCTLNANLAPTRTMCI